MANPNVAKYKEESKSYRAQQMVTRDHHCWFRQPE